jgi:signal transduction histidine kinase
MPAGNVAPTDPRLDSFTETAGLSADYAFCLLVDREGNVWVGTTGGLDQFRRSSFGFIPSPARSSVSALVPGDRGALWVASLAPNYLTRYDRGASDFQLAGPYIDTAYRDPFGILWLGIPDYIAAMTDSDATAGSANRENAMLREFAGPIPVQDRTIVRSFPGVTFRPLNPPLLPGKTREGPVRTKAITEDGQGRLWISTDAGTFRIDNSGWRSLTSFGGPPGPANAEFTDSEGRVWFGAGNAVAVIDGEAVRTWSGADAVDVGTVTSIQEQDSKIWIGGESGLAYFDGQRFQTVEPGDGTAFGPVTGLVSTPGEGLWVSATDGVVHIPESQLSHLSPTHNTVADRVYGSLDGFTAEVASGRTSLAVRTTDGRIWVGTNKGLYWIDPEHTPHNSLPPPVFIDSLAANGRSYNRSHSVTLPPHTRDLQIAYTATSLTIPQRVLFQYRLEGQDRAWHASGTRREAFYTNLAPGAYTFHVIACNNDGIWNKDGAALTIFIEPAWYQTLWFRLGCIVGALLILWSFYRLRMRQIAKSAGARFDERLAERTQIARELHDTLVQTIQSSKMVADDALEQCAEPRTRRALEKLSLWLAHATDESRTALNSLRLSTTVRNDLAEALQRASENAGISESMSMTFSVVGDAREMHPIVRDEIYRIAYEAIRNAQSHSHATQLTIELRYGQDLTILVQDNGVGIDPAVAGSGKEGHFGLQGMRERAARIRGKLTLVSSVAAGTRVVLTVPAVVAFSSEKPGILSRARILLTQWARRMH